MNRLNKTGGQKQNSKKPKTQTSVKVQVSGCLYGGNSAKTLRIEERDEERNERMWMEVEDLMRENSRKSVDKFGLGLTEKDAVLRKIEENRNKSAQTRQISDIEEINKIISENQKKSVRK